MKTILLLPLPSRAMPLIEWLGPEAGREVVLLATKEVADEYSGWAGAVVSFDNYSCPAVEYVAMRLAREHRIERVVAISESDILRGATLRRALGLAGQSVESALAFRDKVVMKSLVRAAGIEVAEHVAISSPEELSAFIDRVGYPVVGKPRAGSGSTGTFVLENTSAVESVLRSLSDLAGGLVESFVHGAMFHVDGIVHRGRVAVVSPSRYVNGCLAFQRGESHCSLQIAQDHPLHARLVALTHAVLAAMPCPEIMPFHLEVFHTPDDRIVFNEIACRVGGGRIREMVELAYGVDIARPWVEHQFGRNVEVAPPRRPTRLFGDAVVPPRAGRIASFAKSLELPGVRDVLVECKEDQELSPPGMSYAAMATILAEAETESELEARLSAAVAAFQESCRYHPTPA